MIIKPYAADRDRRSLPVALVDGDGLAWDEHGNTVGSQTHALYIGREDARDLLTAGHGRGLYWRDRLIEWRPWPDVGVRVLPADNAPASFADRLTGLVIWSAWLAQHGVELAGRNRESAPASIGSASMRTLKATLRETLWTSAPTSECPPIHGVLGGRQECPAPPGAYTDGPFELWDMRAAYASTLAATPYGGRWRHLGRATARRMDWPRIVASGTPAFLRCRVRLGRGDDAENRSRRVRRSEQGRPAKPEQPSTLGDPMELPDHGRLLSPGDAHAGRPGPLPRRPRGHRSHVDSDLSPVEYPRAGLIQGIWTAAEVVAAEAAGAGVRILDGWLHMVDSRSLPFARWWSVVEEGRTLPGYAGTLAKMTGNALIGQFHIDLRTVKRRVWWERGVKRSERVRRHGGVRPAWDLAEHVTGTVRSRLYAEALWPLGDAVLAAHTDSVWVRRTDDEKNLRGVRGANSPVREVRDEHRGTPDILWPVRPNRETVSSGMGTTSNPPAAATGSWRHDDTAEAVDLIDSQHLAYRRPGDPRTYYKMAGVPQGEEEAAMDQLWASAFGQGPPQRRTRPMDHVAETASATRRRKVNA